MLSQGEDFSNSLPGGGGPRGRPLPEAAVDGRRRFRRTLSGVRHYILQLSVTPTDSVKVDFAVPFW